MLKFVHFQHNTYFIQLPFTVIPDVTWLKVILLSVVASYSGVRLMHNLFLKTIGNEKSAVREAVMDVMEAKLKAQFGQPQAQQAAASK